MSEPRPHANYCACPRCSRWVIAHSERRRLEQIELMEGRSMLQPQSQLPPSPHDDDPEPFRLLPSPDDMPFPESLRALRWAIAGVAVLFVALAITALVAASRY